MDAIPLHYEYTAGVAGEAFLRGLMDGKILATYCPNCKRASLPARIYCVDCYGETSKKPVRAGPVGVVRAITKLGPDGADRGQGEEDDAGFTFVFVEFPGVSGGMVHRALGKVRAGTRVRPRFKPRAQRAGSITDIVGFERAV